MRGPLSDKQPISFRPLFSFSKDAIFWQGGPPPSPIRGGEDGKMFVICSESGLVLLPRTPAQSARKRLIARWFSSGLLFRAELIETFTTKTRQLFGWLLHTNKKTVLTVYECSLASNLWWVLSSEQLMKFLKFIIVGLRILYLTGNKGFYCI